MGEQEKFFTEEAESPTPSYDSLQQIDRPITERKSIRDLYEELPDDARERFHEYIAKINSWYVPGIKKSKEVISASGDTGCNGRLWDAIFQINEIWAYSHRKAGPGDFDSPEGKLWFDSGCIDALNSYIYASLHRLNASLQYIPVEIRSEFFNRSLGYAVEHGTTIPDGNGQEGTIRNFICALPDELHIENIEKIISLCREFNIEEFYSNISGIITQTFRKLSIAHR